MPTKDYNIQPYYDDFDETKGYHRVLFKPNFAVQARELTQAQTILQDQIQKNSSFENGESMSSGQLNVYTNIAYVSLSADLGSNETAESIVGKVITNQPSLGGVTAKIVAVAPKDVGALESLTIYIAYLKNTASSTTFADGNSLYEVTTGSSVSSSAWKTIGKITGYTSPTSNVGTGSIAQVESGIYYINGYATYVPKQTIILDKYTNTPTYKLGFDVSETITTSTDDVSLNDNSVTSTNYQAPGADRHKVQLTLSKRSLTVSSTEGFVEVCEVVNGIINLKRKISSEKEREVVSGLDYEIRENLSTLTDVNGIAGTDSSGSGNKFSFGVSAGIGKIDGKEVVHQEKTYLAIDKARDSVTKSTTTVNSGAELGNYVVTNGDFKTENSGTNTVSNFLNFAPSNGNNYLKVTLVSKTEGKLFGEARVRNIERDGVDFRIYLFDIKFFGRGKTLSDVEELHQWDTNNNYLSSRKLCDLQTEKDSTYITNEGVDITLSHLKDTNKNALLHEMPYSGISRITGAVSISKIRKTFTVNATNSNTITLTTTGEVFSSDSSNTIIYGLQGSGKRTFLSTEITITGTGTSTLTLTSSGLFTEDSSYTIVTSTVLSSPALATREIEQEYDGTSGNTRSEVERKVIPLTKTNIHPYSWKVYMSSGFNVDASTSGTDITERYTLDTGQREDFHDFGAIRLKDNQAYPTGKIVIVYWHYPTSSTGDYVNVQSYPLGRGLVSNNGVYGNVPFVSNADGGTIYNLSDVPIYTSSISGRKYRLNECVDLRPVKGTNSGNQRFNGSGANKMVIPDQATISQTGIVQFLGRIDKVYLDSNGVVRVKSGVPSTNPSIPENPSDSIPLYNIRLLPYTYDLHDIVVESLFDNNQRETDFSAISSLEKSAKDFQLPDGRKKRNTFSDPFVGHGYGDVTDKEFSASIDLQKGELRPRYKTESVPLVTHSRVNHSTPAQNTTLTVGEFNGTAKNVVTLPYTSLAEIQNLNSNSERTLRNTDSITYNGVVYIKEWDNYKSSRSRPMIKNRNDDFVSIPYLQKGFNAQGTIWNEWETEWYGVQDTTIPEPKLDMGYNELDKSPNYYNVIGKEINGKKVEDNYTSYIRSKTFTINAYGLKPNCILTSVKFDGIEIISDLTVSGNYVDGDNRKTDVNGKFVATYTIPNVDESVGTTKFTTGSKKLVISGNDNYAEGYYHAVGLFDDDGYLTKPYDNSWNEQTNETIFQEFEVFEETFITKLDLYFTAEDLFDRSVTVQIRKIEDDKPSKKVLPYSIVSKIPSDFIASTTGTQVEFTFDETIFLKRGRYAIAIITPSVEYKVQTLKVEKTKGSKGTGVGNLYIGTQKITDEILKFSLYRAKFTATTDDAIIKSSFGNTLLNPNPLKVYTYKTTTGYSTPTLEIEHEGHGFSVGDDVSFSGIQGRNEHDVLLSSTPDFTIGDIVYQNASALTGDDVYTVPYGRILSQNTTDKIIQIATESGIFSSGTIRTSSKSNTISSDANSVQTVKRLRGLHIGSVTGLAIDSSNSGTGYTNSTASTGVATTNFSGASGGTGSGTGLRVKITANGSITSVDVIFAGHGYETGDVVLVTTGDANARLTITARGVNNISYPIIASGFTADKYAIANADLGSSLGATGYADGENAVTVTKTKRRVDMIRYNAKQFIPDGTTLIAEESDSTSLTTTEKVDFNTNIYYDNPKYLGENAVLKLTMTGDFSNDRLSPVFDISSASSLSVANITSNSDYISRKLELEQSANSVYVIFDAMLSKGNSVGVYAKTIESSSRDSFDGSISVSLNADLNDSNTTITLSTTDINRFYFNAGDIVTIGEEDILLGTLNGDNEFQNSTRGYNGTDSVAHVASNSKVSKDAVQWIQLSQVGTTFDADFPDFKKMVYSIDNLSDFSVLQLKINMNASNYAMPPRIKNLRVIPNYKDDSLKPLQTKTSIITKADVATTSFSDSYVVDIDTDFVVEEATVFLTEVKDNTTIKQLSDAGVEIRTESDGSITPLFSDGTGAKVRYRADGTYDIVAIAILTGRRK